MVNKDTMKVFETISNSVKDTVSSVKRKSEDLVEISKLAANLNSKNLKIDELYSKIGQVVVLKHESNIYIDPDLVEYANEVMNLKDDIGEIESTILTLRNKRVCPNCGTPIDKSVHYCPKCGLKQEFEDSNEEASDNTEHDTNEK